MDFAQFIRPVIFVAAHVLTIFGVDLTRLLLFIVLHGGAPPAVIIIVVMARHAYCAVNIQIPLFLSLTVVLA